MKSPFVGAQQPDQRWQAYLAQLAAVKPYLSPWRGQFAMLEHAPRAFILDVPVRMDDDRVQHFEGYAVMQGEPGTQGPADVQYRPDVDLDEVLSRAVWRRLRHALVGLPLDSVAGGVRLQPTAVSATEMNRLASRYHSQLATMHGGQPPRLVRTHAVDADHRLPADSAVDASTAGAEWATGRGMFGIVKRAAAKLRLNLQGARVAIHGMSGAAAVFAQCLSLAGAKIVAVGDRKGATADLAGIDPVALARWVHIHDDVSGFPWAWRLSPGDFWEVPCDLLVLVEAGLPLSIEQTARVRARLVMEGSNGAISPEAEAALIGKGAMVVPALMCEAARCALEQARTTQGALRRGTSEQDLRAATESMLDEAFDSVWQVKTLHSATLRQATVATACIRLLDGWATPGATM